MTEALSIFLQLLIFLVLFSFPFTPKFLNNSLNLKKTVNIIDAHTINIIFFLYVSLILSFTNIALETFFKGYLLLSIFFVFYNLKNLKLDLSNSFIFFLFILIVFSIFVSIAQNLRLESDGHLWLEKVLIFFNGEDIKLITTVPTHPEYPHLGSYIWAFFWKNSILELEYFGRFFQPYFYIISIFLIVNSLNFKNKNLKIFFILFLILITYDAYLFSGYQEYLIFTTLVIASRYIFLIDFKNSANTNLIFLIILILYINSWFKDEGLVYFILFSSVLVLFLNVTLKYKLYFFLSIIFLFLIQYFLQKYIIGLHGFPHNNLLSIFSELSNFKILFTKIFKITLGFLISFFKYPLWLIVLISAFFLVFFVKKLETISKYLMCCLILNFGFLMVIFLSFYSYEWYIRVTLDRLLFQTSGFYLIFFLIIMKKIKILNN